MIYCRFPARALQPLSDWRKFQDNCENTAGTDSSNSVSAICEGWRQCIASVKHWLLTLKNSICKIGHCILPKSEKLKLDQFNWTLPKHFIRDEPVQVVWVTYQHLVRPFFAQPCSGWFNTSSPSSCYGSQLGFRLMATHSSTWHGLFSSLLLL